jgi:calcineurin-like phosphoesterase family protein
MGWFFTADWHLNHANIIKYCDRPFLTLEEKRLVELCKTSKDASMSLKGVKISKESVDRMNETIIESTNNVVGESDNLVILGDFCWTSTPKETIAQFMSKLKCKNVYLVWGNHDNRQTFLPFFKSTYDQYTFHIEGQHIFVSHYPCKSWNLAYYGSWMLYGHVHNGLYHLDNGLMLQKERDQVKESIEKLLKSSCSSFDCSLIDDTVTSIGKVFRRSLLSLDVGVDNLRDGLPFGTPWSFGDIKSLMESRLISLSCSG